MPDHVHMLILIPPKYAVSQVVGFSVRNQEKERISGSISSNCGADPSLGGTTFWGRVSDPIYRLGRFLI